MRDAGRPEGPLRASRRPDLEGHLRDPRRRRSARAPTSRSPAARATATSPRRDSYVDDYYGASIVEAYDMVWLDQRGIGLSGPIQCTKAAATYYQSTARPQVPAERDAAAAAAETFAKDCVAETGVAEADLPFYATKQAVEDLEAVRALPRRRQDGPLRPELWHAVRADLRGRPPRPHRDALRRRPGRPDDRRPDLLRRGHPLR